MKKCSGWKNVKNRCFQIYLRTFCVCLLTYNALQHLSFFIFVFLTHFWTNWRRLFPRLFSMLLVEVRGSKCGDRAGTNFKIPVYRLCYFFSKRSVASSNINKHSNTHAWCMQLRSVQLSKTVVWKWLMQSVVNVSHDLCKGFFMNDWHQQFYE